ncbi:hypothetical protein MLD38_040393 [Melastoma candidum]|uniref:Uncharacterized protein n=1 Tax=Melastoma candidum TaxID=119954 RepID=A0ACB9L5K4_9MYRT|nr:hypothetical protein MLD38_040393 [Melastoma candidum]
MTFPGHPSGRYSNGLVLTDFLARHFGAVGLSPIPFEQWRKVWRHPMLYFGSLLFGINFAHGGTGVFDTDVAAPNMTVQIDLFEQLVKKHYGDIGLENSIALVTSSGNDYSAYMARNNGTLDPKDVMHFIDEVTTQLAANLKRIQALGVKKILYNVGQMNDESTNNSTVVVLDLCNAFLDILQGKDYESRFPEGLKGC